MGEAIRRRTVASETGVELAPRVAKHRVGKIVAVEDVDGLMDLPSADASRWPVLVRVLEATRTEFAIKGWPRPRIRVGADGAPVIVSERWKGDFDELLIVDRLTEGSSRVRVLRQEIEVEEPPVVLGEAFRARLSWAGVTKVAAGAVALVGLAVWEWLR